MKLQEEEELRLKKLNEEAKLYLSNLNNKKQVLKDQAEKLLGQVSLKHNQ